MAVVHEEPVRAERDGASRIPIVNARSRDSRDAYGGAADLALALAFGEVLHLALIGAACDSGGALGFGRGFLARGAFEALALGSIFSVLGIHSSVVIPAYF